MIFFFLLLNTGVKAINSQPDTAQLSIAQLSSHQITLAVLTDAKPPPLYVHTRILIHTHTDTYTHSAHPFVVWFSQVYDLSTVYAEPSFSFELSSVWLCSAVLYSALRLPAFSDISLQVCSPSWLSQTSSGGPIYLKVLSVSPFTALTCSLWLSPLQSDGEIRDQRLKCLPFDYFVCSSFSASYMGNFWASSCRLVSPKYRLITEQLCTVSATIYRCSYDWRSFLFLFTGLKSVTCGTKPVLGKRKNRTA